MNRLSKIYCFSKKEMSESDKKLSQYVQKVDRKTAQRRALERTFIPFGDTVGALGGGVGGKKYHTVNALGTITGGTLGAMTGKKAAGLAMKGLGAGRLSRAVVKTGSAIMAGRLGMIYGNRFASGYQYDKAKKNLTK